MVYFMIIYVDGGCRGNGKPGAIGAAACVFKLKWGRTKSWTRVLQPDPRPTNQRSEIEAIILALEQALEKYDELQGYPDLRVKIHSDSKYAIGCMTEWIYKWSANGWLNASGLPVVNQSLIQEASELDDRLRELGTVTYHWVPREDNTLADQRCNWAMDNYERQLAQEDSDSSSYY